jgi:hypothetical protein
MNNKLENFEPKYWMKKKVEFFYKAKKKKKKTNIFKNKNEKI